MSEPFDFFRRRCVRVPVVLSCAAAVGGVYTSYLLDAAQKQPDLPPAVAYLTATTSGAVAAVDVAVPSTCDEALYVASPFLNPTFIRRGKL